MRVNLPRISGRSCPISVANTDDLRPFRTSPSSNRYADSTRCNLLREPPYIA